MVQELHGITAHSTTLIQVHSYIHVAAGRTAYLSELRSGSEVVVVDGASGRQRTALVGRVKIESRPLVSGGSLSTEAVGEWRGSAEAVGESRLSNYRGRWQKLRQ